MSQKSGYEERPWLKAYPRGVPTEVEIPLKTVAQAFDEATEKWKNRTALIFYGKKITYGELRRKVDGLARGLNDLGIREGDVIAFLLLNSPEHVIAFYAASKLGAIITPISAVYVSSEIKHQLEISGAESILCQDILYEGVEKTGIKLTNVILCDIAESLPRTKKLFGKSILRGVYQKMAAPSSDIILRQGFHRFEDLIRDDPGDLPEVKIDTKVDVMMLPFTSGTSGAPKGVMISQYNVIADEAQYKAFNPFFEDGKDVFIAYMPFYHTAGQFTALLCGIMWGATVVVITTPDLDDILTAISKYKATMFGGTPAIFEALKDYEKTDRVKWKKLKIIISGADALHEATAIGWNERTDTDLSDLYGMTELTCISHMTPTGKGKVGSIGIPFPNTLAAILDPDRDDFVPVGELGEIVINGPQVTSGYWNNPDATAECEAVINGVRWWRTGDLGRMDEEGHFYFYDRKRDLIKYKGLRVYAREVEEVLKSHPKIKEVGVIGVPDIKVGENVCAMVVLEGDARGEVSEQDVIDYCKEELAHYKIPKIIDFVGEIPKTDVGKVSRRELREGEM